MADRRRRRALEDEGEETVPVETEKGTKARQSECESEGEPADTDVVSEYESATEDSRDAGADEEESEEGTEDEEEETEEETEEGSEDEEEEYTDEDVIVEGEDQIEEERQSGDGEEQPDKENVDDDEDKKNPAYVPRKGAFYEHDTRTGEEQAPEKDLKPKKKLWQDEGKWSHDRYHEDLQAPKSREELIAIYGYDIRASDKPPDAPPRRKTGNRGGRPSQRRTQLRDYMNPSRPPPQQQQQQQQHQQPQQQQQHQHQRMAVIDTTDYGNKQRTRPPPPESYDDYEDDIDVPYMTTIDTTESSADNYHPSYQRPRGGRRGRDNRQAYGERAGRRQGPRSQHMQSQDPYYVQSQDVRSAPPQNSRVQNNRDLQSQDYRQHGYRSQDNRSRETRGHGDYRNRNSYRYNENREEDYAERNSYSAMRGSARGGNRGGNFGRGSRGRERNERAPRYNKMEHEAQASNVPPYDVAPREFTNTSLKNTASHEGSANSSKNSSVSLAGPAEGKGRQTSQDVVISNKENVQTISVTITNTTTERKSYAKERRGKPGAGRGQMQNPAGEVTDVGDKRNQMVLEAPPAQDADDNALGPDDQKLENFQAGSASRQEQSRPKRYSSQRQRNAPEAGASDQTQSADQKQASQQGASGSGPGFFNQTVYPRGPPATFYHSEQAGAPRPVRPPPPQDTTFGTPMLQPPIPFHLPVSGPGMPSPPRMFGPTPGSAPPPPVPISSTSPQLLPAPYLAAPGVIYSAPPPPPGASAPYQMPLGYNSPPPAAPPPAALTQQPVTSPPQNQSELYRGGTIYYPPHLQQPPSRSPARRPKAAIPIVDPQEARKKTSLDRSTDEDERSLDIEDFKEEDPSASEETHFVGETGVPEPSEDAASVANTSSSIHQEVQPPQEADPAPSSPTALISHIDDAETVQSKVSMPDVQPLATDDAGPETGASAVKDASVPTVKETGASTEEASQVEQEAVASS